MPDRVQLWDVGVATETSGKGFVAGHFGGARVEAFRVRLWPWVRRLLVAALLAVGVWVSYSHRNDLKGVINRLGNIEPGWLLLAILFEVQSMFVFARLQRWLLRAGGVRLRPVTMVEITLAGNALGTTLPGGAAWSAAWAFGQLRRRGADRVLAGWVLLVAGALSSFAIFIILVVGTWVAGSKGPVSDLRILTLVLALIPVAAAAGYLLVKRWGLARSLAGRFWQWLGVKTPHGQGIEAGLERFLVRVKAVRPSRLGWAEAFGLALVNWIADGAALVCSLLALGIHVPWQGILVTYGLVQVSASLPITPGGIGVVEGSLTALLVAYGVTLEAALAGALLYRVVSFWGLVPIGWGSWAYLELMQRHRAVAGRPHPWAFHLHGGNRAAEPARPRLLRSSPCEGCEESENARPSGEEKAAS